MAENMRDLKRRMKSIESTEHITNAMRLVSSAKYRRAKSMYDKKSEQLQDVSATIEDILAEDEEFSEAHAPAASGGNCSDRMDQATDGSKGKTLAIILASDRGLCGGFNTSLIKEGVSALENIPKQQVEVFCIGSRGKDFFEHSGYKVVGEYIGAPEKMSFGEIRQITEPMIEGYADGSIERILLVYTKYINSLKQEPVVRQLLPAESRETQKQQNPAVAEASGSGNLESAASGLGVTEIEYLPSKAEVIRYMVPKYFQLTLFQAVMESAVCEHAARRTAMENATDNARDILGNLSLTYNRVRQAAITNELIEIVSGAELQE